MEEKKKMERHDEKGRLSMAENNYGDHYCTPSHSSVISIFCQNFARNFAEFAKFGKINNFLKHFAIFPKRLTNDQMMTNVRLNRSLDFNYKGGAH